MQTSTRTEHNGARNGGGYWGKREVAKQRARKNRRRAGKLAAKNML